MRIPRRGVIAQDKEPKYIWRVYNVAQELDESTATAGSFSLSQSRYKMAASAFTYSNGTFNLTNAVQTTAANLKVGDYLVSVNTSNSTSTGASAIYRITAISGSSTRTISYKQYTAMADVQGSTFHFEIGSDTLDYPLDGIYDGDGLWYVMVKGEKEMYVWNFYNVSVNFKTNAIAQWPTRNTTNYTNYLYDVSETAYLIDGEFSLKEPIISGVAPSKNYVGYWELRQGVSRTAYLVDLDTNDEYANHDFANRVLKTTIGTKTVIETYESSNPDAYIQGGLVVEVDGPTIQAVSTEVSGGATFVFPGFEYSHSYMKAFDDR